MILMCNVGWDNMCSMTGMTHETICIDCPTEFQHCLEWPIMQQQLCIVKLNQWYFSPKFVPEEWLRHHELGLLFANIGLMFRPIVQSEKVFKLL